MKKFIIGTTLVVTAALVLSGCTSRTDEAKTDAAAGFDAGATIGVALPDKTSENWVLAGQLFTDGLTEAGFKPDVQYAPASNTVAEQQNQINAMVTNGAKVIIIGAKDSKQLSAQVEAAKEQGVIVVAYDRLIENTEAVDYYVAFDNFKVGQLQGQALLDGLAARLPDKDAYNIELFSGDPNDPNAAVFFKGAMDKLQPKIDDGTLTVVSGETSIEQTATADWAAENAQSRMDTLLQGSYQGADVDGVLAPNDNLARAILTSVEAAGKPQPVVTGQDSEVESVKSIVAGKQYMTIYKDTRALVAQAIDMVKTLQSGDKADTTTKTNNGSADVATFYLDPVIVTQDNAAEAYAENEALLALTK